jgi:hypothetical protein
MLNMIWVQNKILILMERRVELMAYNGVGGFRLVGKNGDGLLEVCGVPLERRALSRLLKIASRNGVLHRCLSMGQRMYIGLVVKLVDRVSSLLVARVLAPIIVRLLEALRGFPKLMMEVLGRVKYWMIVKGREKAEEISRIAQKWGNKTAHKWAKETGFIRFITIMYMPLWESQSIRQTYAN